MSRAFDRLGEIWRERGLDDSESLKKLNESYKEWEDCNEEFAYAIEFMKKAHAGQTRNNGTEPYENHPIMVSKILWEVGVYNVGMHIGAILHDVVEDTEYTLQDIEDRWGYPVVWYVRHLTMLPRPEGMSRKEYLKAQWPQYPDSVKTIKLADRFHNLSDLPYSGWPVWKQRRYAKEALLMLELFTLYGDPGSGMLREAVRREAEYILNLKEEA